MEINRHVILKKKVDSQQIDEINRVCQTCLFPAMMGGKEKKKKEESHHDEVTGLQQTL